ncbi:hypothetical protein BDSB_21185 [Burkholderia dolosa PC543]|nr:hypothetical protein BDSB_21185 [Burkholderia dolosa PC543]
MKRPPRCAVLCQSTRTPRIGDRTTASQSSIVRPGKRAGVSGAQSLRDQSMP